MLQETIKAIRTSKGLSQEELAARLHVVRQTVSKWEQGRSVPDADLLIALSEALETPVSTLLGETAVETEVDRVQAIAEQLEALNRQLARRKAAKRRLLHGLCLAVCGAVIAGFAALLVWGSPYLAWDYGEPETAVLGVAVHSLEWAFVRAAPVLLLAAAVGAFWTRGKK